MFGPILSACGTLFQEIGSVVSKSSVEKKLESVYTMVFLNLFWQAVIFL